MRLRRQTRPHPVLKATEGKTTLKHSQGSRFFFVIVMSLFDYIVRNVLLSTEIRSGGTTKPCSYSYPFFYDRMTEMLLLQTDILYNVNIHSARSSFSLLCLIELPWK